MVITNFKLYENRQKAESIIKKLNIDKDNEDYQKIKELVKDKPNFFGQFVKWFFINKTPFGEIEEIYKMINTYNIKMSKPIDSFDKAEDLYDFIQDSLNSSKVNKIIKSIPSRARQKVNDEIRNLFKTNVKYADELIKLFSKIGGRYSNDGRTSHLTSQDLYDDINNFIDNLEGGFNADTIKKIINKNNLNAKVILDSYSLMVVEIGDFQASKKLGSQSWCIVTSENQWQNYVNEFTTQFYIYDFTKKRSDNRHAIGITVGPSFLSNSKQTAMHWSDDTTGKDPISGLSIEEYIDELNYQHNISDEELDIMAKKFQEAMDK